MTAGKRGHTTLDRGTYVRKVDWGNRLSKWFLKPYTSSGTALAVPANMTKKTFLRAECASRHTC
eukprot:3569081-Amphidinium_carterae.1